MRASSDLVHGICEPANRKVGARHYPGMHPVVCKHYRLPSDCALPAGKAVVPQPWLRAMESADSLLVAAQAQCQRVLDEAATQAQRDAFEAALQAQRTVWTNALAGVRAFEAARQALLARAEVMSVQLAQAALERLLLDVPPDWPARSSARLVLEQRAGLGDVSRQAELRVHPDDVDAVLQAQESREHIVVRADAAVPAGQCILSAGDVQLGASYEASVQAVLAAIADVAKEVSEPKQELQ